MGCLCGLMFSVSAQTITEPSQPGLTSWPVTDQILVQGLQRDGRLDQALHYLLQQESRYAGVYDYDYQLALVAIELKRWSIALQALDRVVLVKPNHGGAWLDLAWVYEALGDQAAAQSVLQHVETHLAPDVRQRQLILRMRARLIAQARQPWLFELGVYGGRVSNVNAGLSHLNLLLTPIDFQPIAVRLDQHMAARSDYAWLVRVGASLAQSINAQSQWSCHLGAGARTYFKESAYGLQDAQLACALDHDWWRGWYLQAGGLLRHVQMGHESVGQTYETSGAVYRRWQGFEWGGRVSHEWRRYQSAGYYDSQTPWIGAWVTYRDMPWQVVGTYRYGQDQAQGARPGGDITKQEWVLQSRYQWHPQWTGEALVLLGQYQDAQGYSPLLARGERRWVQRWVWRVTLEWQAMAWLDKNMYVSAYYENSKDHSNIATNQLSDQQFFVGWKYRWR